MKPRILFLLLFTAAAAHAVSDAPPERDEPVSPPPLPSLEGERPRVRGTLRLSFSGNHAFSDYRLREGILRQIQAIEEYGLDEANAYDAGFFVESYYRKHGYPDVEVNAAITAPWSLTLEISEGPLVRLETISISGNQAYDAATLLKYLLGPTRERFPRIHRIDQLPFVESDIQSGVDLVARLYAAEGYLDAVVDPPEFAFPRQQTADISLSIHEGIQYRFGDITWIGSLIFPKEELLGKIATETKNIFTDGRLAAAQRKLEDYYKRNGYFTAEVTVSGDPATAVDGLVPVVVTVKPGLLFHFDGSVVTGNSSVKTSFIQKRLNRLTGKTYDPALIDRQFRELMSTGLFSNLRITPEVLDQDEVKLNVSVDEAKAREFGIGLGYASFNGGIVNLSYANRNLFGTGRPLTIDVEANQRGFQGQIDYSDPWWFDSDYSFDLKLYAMTRFLKGYSKRELGVVPSVTRHLTEHLEVGAFVRAKVVGVYDVLIEPESLVGPDVYSVLAGGLSVTFDRRNDPAVPTRGYIFGAAVDFAPDGISDISFLRGVARFSYYIPVTAKSSLALGVRGGIISPLSGETLPIDERFFNGGATSVRSFSELTLGPKDHVGYPLGGETFTVFNVEYDFPLIGDLHGAVFFDAGNVLQDAGDFGLQDMRYAVGAGLRYNLPIGALRLDYGYNPDRQPGEAQGAWHFAIGVAF